MGLDGALGDDELFGDAAIAVPAGDQHRYLPLAGGEKILHCYLCRWSWWSGSRGWGRRSLVQRVLGGLLDAHHPSLCPQRREASLAQRGARGGNPTLIVVAVVFHKGS